MRGLLVARHGHDRRRLPRDRRAPPRRASDPGRVNVEVEVEVANFYPAIASRLSRFVYTHTQSRIHVIVTHGFLRSLARLDLEESLVGRFVSTDDVPDPTAPSPRERQRRPSTRSAVALARVERAASAGCGAR